MTDPRIRALAKNLVTYSTRVQAGDAVLIENTGLERPLVLALVEAVYEAGGMPFVWLKDESVERALRMGLTPAQADLLAESEARWMERMNAYIGVRSARNASELGDVPPDKQNLFAARVWSRVHGMLRVPKTRWVVLRYPSPAMAQRADMSTAAFEDFYFDVCLMDYARMARAMAPLIERMERAQDVRIVGPGTDLRFSIAGLPAIPCAGTCNIPDGEVYTAPVRDSVCGTIAYNTPSVHDGFTFEQISFTFERGKIVDAAANDTPAINRVLDLDEGARYVGEFALGVNPYITKPMKDTLFDEKIAGSFHFTPGASYDDCFNGNRSALHWDLVAIQRPEYGGGEIYFDGELIRKDGLFVPGDLLPLNPDRLKAREA